ncbi:uncharacterized protein LOC126898470 [Daktulosphaira vitifoliae]|uniref:uncharacterized protein LOC126898470 n=1 Tax=Daktulosphaira vitifoliae TaxID=58002 RepID=UPI0021AA069A|nr:uncharacterized protein LOC126898470 [Daktulosphaira vitifoliae]
MIVSWENPRIQPGITREEELILLQALIPTISSYLLIHKEMIARYLFLIPNHYADKQLLKDIESIIHDYDNKLSGLYHWILNVKTPYEEDLLKRCSFKMNLTEKEKSILKEYYLRHNLDPDEQFDIRKEFVKSLDFVYAPSNRQARETQ